VTGQETNGHTKKEKKKEKKKQQKDGETRDQIPWASGAPK